MSWLLSHAAGPQVFCYALNPDDRSAFRSKIRASVGEEHFRDLSGVPDDQEGSCARRPARLWNMRE